jgi:hypothetical protein
VYSCVLAVWIITYCGYYQSGFLIHKYTNTRRYEKCCWYRLCVYRGWEDGESSHTPPGMSLVLISFVRLSRPCIVDCLRLILQLVNTMIGSRHGLPTRTIWVTGQPGTASYHPSAAREFRPGAAGSTSADVPKSSSCSNSFVGGRAF